MSQDALDFLGIVQPSQRLIDKGKRLVIEQEVSSPTETLQEQICNNLQCLAISRSDDEQDDILIYQRINHYIPENEIGLGCVLLKPPISPPKECKLEPPSAVLTFTASAAPKEAKSQFMFKSPVNSQPKNIFRPQSPPSKNDTSSLVNVPINAASLFLNISGQNNNSAEAAPSSCATHGTSSMFHLQEIQVALNIDDAQNRPQTESSELVDDESANVANDDGIDGLGFLVLVCPLDDCFNFGFFKSTVSLGTGLGSGFGMSMAPASFDSVENVSPIGLTPI
ncbi:hypothetical protein ACH5RR_001936 [Cinchona calisaya]|uniref:Uncharacterized protein n=1 Tax=Cinchona calisaya TaxID=153742 RepID=A0ABD3B4W9_9GENT